MKKKAKDYFDATYKNRNLRAMDARDESLSRRLSSHESLSLAAIADDVEYLSYEIASIKRTLHQRLCILENVDVEKLQQYQVLRDLYDQYRAAEALLMDNGYDEDEQ